VISAEASRVAVRVMHTDEEWMIAKTVCSVLGLTTGKEYGREGKKSVEKDR
jgi:acetate kinase